jgi:hypothetical protein
LSGGQAGQIEIPYASKRAELGAGFGLPSLAISGGMVVRKV